MACILFIGSSLRWRKRALATETPNSEMCERASERARCASAKILASRRCCFATQTRRLTNSPNDPVVLMTNDGNDGGKYNGSNNNGRCAVRSALTRGPSFIYGTCYLESGVKLELRSRSRFEESENSKHRVRSRTNGEKRRIFPESSARPCAMINKEINKKRRRAGGRNARVRLDKREFLLVA